MYEADEAKRGTWNAGIDAVAALDLVHGMLQLHGERDQPHALWISARAEVARRGMNRSDRAALRQHIYPFAPDIGVAVTWELEVPERGVNTHDRRCPSL